MRQLVHLHCTMTRPQPILSPDRPTRLQFQWATITFLVKNSVHSCSQTTIFPQVSENHHHPLTMLFLSKGNIHQLSPSMLRSTRQMVSSTQPQTSLCKPCMQFQPRDQFCMSVLLRMESKMSYSTHYHQVKRTKAGLWACQSSKGGGGQRGGLVGIFYRFHVNVKRLKFILLTNYSKLIFFLYVVAVCL